MARVINAERSTIVGTAAQIQQLLARLAGRGAAVVNLDGSNFVVLDKPISDQRLAEALRITPVRADGKRKGGTKTAGTARPTRTRGKR